MCGRYWIDPGEDPDWARIRQNILRRGGGPFRTGDILPADPAPVLTAEGDRIVGNVFRWGIRGPDGKRLLINARAETALEKRLFRDGVRTRRCVLPASGFYERDAGRRLWKFRPETGNLLYLAGFRNPAEDGERFVILTTAPNGSVAPVHGRMPLLLRREQVRPWLTDLPAARELLARRPEELRRAPQDGQEDLFGPDRNKGGTTT